MSATLQFRKTTNDLGGAATATQLSATAMNNLWDNVSPGEASSGDTEYRAIDIYNAGDAAATVVSLYDAGTTSPKTAVQMAVEASPIDSTLSVADESTEPAGSLSFAERTSGSPLSLPDIPAGSSCRVWLKRIVDAAAANLATDTMTMTVEYA